MNFKEAGSFLDKITMGAVGTKAVIESLNSHGHEIIELERYCTSNKIWSTKIKRLRMPDLLCLKCGKRIEARAKSALEIKMSDTESNPDRRWNIGLRGEDLIAFINCYKKDDVWNTDGIVNLFAVHSLEEAENCSKLGNPKSPGEGSERDRTWKSYTPKKAGTVTEILKSPKSCIKLKYEDGKAYTYNLKEGYQCYCQIGDKFKANSDIIAGVVQRKEALNCQGEGYDFLEDLLSERKETKYAGIKALGYLPKTDNAIVQLKSVLQKESDARLCLEAYSSLIRLGEDLLDEFFEYAMTIEEIEYKMEFALILGELNDYSKASEILVSIIDNLEFTDELRAAALWSLKVSDKTIDKILECCFMENTIMAKHGIALLENNLLPVMTKYIIENMEDDEKAAICARILISSNHVDEQYVVNEYIETKNLVRKKWLFLVIGLSGRTRYERRIQENISEKQMRCEKFKELWDFVDFYMDSDMEAAIEFIKKQQI